MNKSFLLFILFFFKMAMKCCEVGLVSGSTPLFRPYFRKRVGEVMHYNHILKNTVRQIGNLKDCNTEATSHAKTNYIKTNALGGSTA